MYARRVRRAGVARRPQRAAPSLSTERRPKRRRETRTTTGDGMREEDEERTTAARDVPAEVRRREPPTRAPRTARRRRACASASPRPARSPRRRAKAARRVCAPAAGRTTSTDKCGGSGRRVSGAWDARTVRRIVDPKRGRARAVGRALERQQTIARARPGALFGGIRRGLGGIEGDRGGVWQRVRARPTHRVK